MTLDQLNKAGIVSEPWFSRVWVLKPQRFENNLCQDKVIPPRDCIEKAEECLQR